MLLKAVLERFVFGGATGRFSTLYRVDAIEGTPAQHEYLREEYVSVPSIGSMLLKARSSTA